MRSGFLQRALLAALFTLTPGCGTESSDPRDADSARAAIDTATTSSNEGAPVSRSDAGDAIWSGQTGPYRVRFDTSDIEVMRDAARVLSVRASIDRAMSGALPVGDDTSATECNEEYDLRVLSAVGNILSVEQRHYSYCEGLPHPSIYTGYHAIDLARTERDGVVQTDGSEAIGRELSLTDIFPDRDLLEALLADRLVQKRLAELRDVKRPTTSAELVGMLEGGLDCEYSFEPDLLRRFAFHHVEGDRVAVRIGLSHGCEAAQGMLTQIGILLPIPPALRGDLIAASKGEGGILMREAARLAPKKTMHLAYRYRVDEATEAGE